MFYLLSLCPILCFSPAFCLWSTPFLAVFHSFLTSSFGSPAAAAGKVLCSSLSFSSSFPSMLFTSVLLITVLFSFHPSSITAENCPYPLFTMELLCFKCNLVLTCIISQLNHTVAKWLSALMECLPQHIMNEVNVDKNISRNTESYDKRHWKGWK